VPAGRELAFLYENTTNAPVTCAGC